VEEISGQPSIQAVVWILLDAFSQFIVKIGIKQSRIICKLAV
jgi:hypothetical protein